MYVCMYVLYACMYFSLIAYSSIQLLWLQVCFNKFSSVTVLCLSPPKPTSGNILMEMTFHGEESTKVLMKASADAETSKFLT